MLFITTLCRGTQEGLNIGSMKNKTTYQDEKPTCQPRIKHQIPCRHIKQNKLQAGQNYNESSQFNQTVILMI